MNAGAALSRSAVRPSGSGRYRVETIRDYASFLRLEPAWNRLMDRARIPVPFMTHEWLRSWIECFAGHRGLLVLVVKQGSEVAGIAPLRVGAGSMYGVPVARIESIQNVYTERFDLLVDGSSPDVYEAIWRHLVDRGPRWDVLELRQLPAGSGTIEHLSRLAAADGFRAERWRSADAPYLPIEGTFASYFETLDSKHRSNLRNRMGRLGRTGEVTLEVIEDPERVASALADGWRLEAAGWKGEAGSAVECLPHVRAFYDLFAARAAGRGWLRLCFLKAGARRVAFGYVLRFRDRHFLLKTGYDPDYAHLGPFMTLCSLMLRDAFERGAVEFDFLGIDDPWKRCWTRTARAHDWLFVFRPGLRSNLARWAKFRVAPRLRRMRRSS